MCQIHFKFGKKTPLLYKALIFPGSFYLLPENDGHYQLISMIAYHCAYFDSDPNADCVAFARVCALWLLSGCFESLSSH